MEGMWKNMDDLAEKVIQHSIFRSPLTPFQDPASYSAFIHEHIKDGPPKPEETRRSFLPIPSFVIKVFDLSVVMIRAQPSPVQGDHWAEMFRKYVQPPGSGATIHSSRRRC